MIMIGCLIQKIKSNVAIFGPWELILHIVIGGIIYFTLAYVFYKNLYISFVCILLSFVHVRSVASSKKRKKKAQIRGQFKDALYALSSSLSAGKSVESAFVKSLEDLKNIYDEKAIIMPFWSEIVNKISINIKVEEAVKEFALATSSEEISSFASALSIGMKSGGNLISILKDTIVSINEKIEVSNQLSILVTKRQYEQKILSYIIPVMILFFNVFSPEFLAPLYGNIKGQLIMTGALIMYIISSEIGKKIVAIEV